MKLRDLRNSVTVRLMMSSAVSLLVAIIGAGALELREAGTRIDAEVQSGMDLADMVIGHSLRNVERAPDPEVAAQQLVHDLGHMRHIVVEYESQDGRFAGNPAQQRTPVSRPPDWFVAMMRRPLPTEVRSVIWGSSARGAIVVTGRAEDEISEIWIELTSQILWLAVIALMITIAMIWIARRALRPIEAVADGMNRLSRGDFTMLSDTDVYELRRIHERFNLLGVSLQRASADNRILIDRMMTLQESEREDIARELHDEIGAALFSLRAELVAWRRPSGENGSVADRIGGLEAIIEEIQWRNGQILTRLRPMVLDHLSLADALRDLLATWSNRVPHMRWAGEIDDCPAVVCQDTALVIYRVIQECLTNAARHSNACHVTVRLHRSVPAGWLHLEIADDGIGPRPSMQLGYGLLGATERVRKLGGSLRVEQNQPRGMAIRFSVPNSVEAPQEAGFIYDASQ